VAACVFHDHEIITYEESGVLTKDINFIVATSD